MMAGYPSKWVPTSNGIAMQRARIILPLAFLVRANDTALHRSWLKTAVDGLLTRKHCEGTWCAYKEELNHTGWGGATKVPNNGTHFLHCLLVPLECLGGVLLGLTKYVKLIEDYGTFEAPLNQANDDPVSDFLYTSNFALLGLHEAAAALGDPAIKADEDKLADYIIRLQARSTEHPELDGAWMRAFDYKKWEAWASDADIGWGAWSVESGWTQSWITTTLGMRQLNTTLWDLGSSLEPTIKGDFDTWSAVMFPPPPPPPPPIPCDPPVLCIPVSTHTICRCLWCIGPLTDCGVCPQKGKPITFTLLTHDEALCAGNTSAPAHVVYTGKICKGTAIQWEAGAIQRSFWRFFSAHFCPCFG